MSIVHAARDDRPSSYLPAAPVAVPQPRHPEPAGPAAKSQVGVAADAQVGAVHVRVAVAQLMAAVPVAAAGVLGGSALGDAVPRAAGACCTVPSSLLVLISGLRIDISLSGPTLARGVTEIKHLFDGISKCRTRGLEQNQPAFDRTD